MKVQGPSALLVLIFFLTLMHPGAARCADELILISPHWEGIRREFERGFNAKRSSLSQSQVEFRWLDVGGASEIVRYVRSRCKSNNIDADILFGGGIDPFMELAKHECLSSQLLTPEQESDLPAKVGGARLRDPDGRWFAAAMSAFGILYNKALSSRVGLPVPNEWRDLQDPIYRSWIGAADPRKSGSQHFIFELLLQRYGWDDGWKLLAGIGRNVRSFSGAGSQVGKDLAVGEIAFGLAIDTQAGDVIRRYGDDYIGFLMPEDVSVVTGDAIAVLHNAPHAALAREFLDYVLSLEGQKLFYAKKGVPGGPLEFELGKLPVNARLYGTIEQATLVRDNPFTWKSDFTYDAALGGARWNLVNDLFGLFIIDSHDILKRVPEAATLFPPITSEEQNALIRGGPETVLARSRRLEGWEERIEQFSWNGIAVWAGTVFSAGLLLFFTVGHRRARQFGKGQVRAANTFR